MTAPAMSQTEVCETYVSDEAARAAAAACSRPRSVSGMSHRRAKPALGRQGRLPVPQEQGRRRLTASRPASRCCPAW